MKGHLLVLRHQDGEDWDYAAIEHLGTKATVEAAGTPAPPAMRDLNAWHGDTFVNGPAWPEFSKAMGIDEGSAAIARYNSWQDFATNEKNSVPDTLKAGGGWLELRNHSTYHNDTITDRIAP